MKFTISTLIALSMAGPAIAKITVSIVTDLASGSLVVKPGGKPIDLSTAKHTTGPDLDPTLKDVTNISFESPNLDDFVRFDIIDNPDSYTQCRVWVVAPPKEDHVYLEVAAPMDNLAMLVTDDNVKRKCHSLKNGDNGSGADWTYA